MSLSKAKIIVKRPFGEGASRSFGSVESMEIGENVLMEFQSHEVMNRFLPRLTERIKSPMKRDERYQCTLDEANLTYEIWRLE